MDEKKMNELMIDYIDGKLTGELKGFVEKYIEKSEVNRREYESLKATVELLDKDRQLEPDSSLRLNFLDELEKMEEAEKSAKVISISYGRVAQIAAAVAILVVGALGGFWLSNQNNKDEQMLALEREMQQTKKMVMMALGDQNSASQRMMGVNASYELPKADDEITSALINTMNTDDNVNVRLAAINALAKFSDDPEVKNALIKALPRQTDPVVQIRLINLMVELREKAAMDELKQIIEDSTNIESVKDEAHMAVFKLS